MAAALKDTRGRKVDPKKLVEERAKPAASGPRRWKFPAIAGGLTPTRLAAILKKADEGDLTDLLSLAYEIERRDSHVGAQIRTRKLAVAGLPWIVEAATDNALDIEIADDLQALVNSHLFSQLVMDLLDAVLKPYAVCEILWQTGEKWTPSGFEWRDQRSFAISPDDGRTLLLKTIENPKGEELEPWKYIIHAPRQFSGPITGSGLVRPLSVMYSVKTLGVSAWAGYTEIFGFPWRIGKYAKGATPEDIEVLAEAVQSIGQQGAAVLSEETNIDIKTATGSSTAVHKQLVEWCDAQTSKAIVGQTLTADTGGGSYAQGKVHEGVRRTLLASDAIELAATIQRDLIAPYVLINWGEAVACPRLRCIVDEPEDRKSFVDTLAPLIDRGLRVEQSVVRDRVGLPAPADDQSVEILHPMGKIPVAS